jgi:alditol oxidase
MITGTHGSGTQHQILASLVTEIDMVFADGTLKTLNRENTANFNSYLMNFGGIGIITAVTIRVEPKYMVHKSIYQDMSWNTLFQNFDDIMLKNDYLSFFMDWRDEKMY